jgi:hypothetical protein
MSDGAATMTTDATYKFHRYVHPEELKGKDKAWHYISGSLAVLRDLFTIHYFWP